MSSSEILNCIQSFTRTDGRPPDNPVVLRKLREFTTELIRLYETDGRLAEDPFHFSRHRRLPFFEEEVRSQIEGKTILITGAEGCVGTALLERLQLLNPRRVVSVDKGRLPRGASCVGPMERDGVFFYSLDITDEAALAGVFGRERPHVVFHLAAQRNPGLAEREVRQTVHDNVLGTRNVIRACEDSGVRACVFSSSGKAYRYHTKEVYAGTKKLAEWQMALAAESGRTTYSVVRFTHMLENSLMWQDFESAVAACRPVGVHGPGRMVVAQNVCEASTLLLNGLKFAAPGRLKISVVRDLGWPVETLDVALSRIRFSGTPVPVYFTGIPQGYEEGFFRGQVDWRYKSDLHPLINVLESAERTLGPKEATIITELEAFPRSTVARYVSSIADAVESGAGDEPLRGLLREASRAICIGTFRLAPVEELLRILRWGTEDEPGAGYCNQRPELIELLFAGLEGRVPEQTIEAERRRLYKVPGRAPRIVETSTAAGSAVV